MPNGQHWTRRVTPRFKGYLRGQLESGGRLLLPLEVMEHADYEMTLWRWRWVEIVARGTRGNPDKVVASRGTAGSRGAPDSAAIVVNRGDGTRQQAACAQ